jgi:hypothetical protein
MIKMKRNFHNRSKKTSVEKVEHDLELDEDHNMHVLGWRIQRIGWGLMGLIFVLAALGLFGTGFISKRVEGGDALKIEYEHFGRYEAEMKIIVRFPSNELTRISIPLVYLRDMKIQQILPDPLEKKIENGNYLITFSGVNKGELTVYLLPQTTGSLNTIVHINDQPFAINHYIYP